MKKFIARIKWHLKELNKTCSNEKSFYSQKRLKAWIIFFSAMIGINIFFYLKIDKLTAMEALSVFGSQMVYAGYQLNKIQQDKKNDNIESKPA